MVSESFLKNEWSNKSFREYIKRIYLTDRDTVLVFVNLASVTNEKMSVLIKEMKHRNVKTNDSAQVYAYESHE